MTLWSVSRYTDTAAVAHGFDEAGRRITARCLEALG